MSKRFITDPTNSIYFTRPPCHIMYARSGRLGKSGWATCQRALYTMWFCASVEVASSCPLLRRLRSCRPARSPTAAMRGGASGMAIERHTVAGGASGVALWMPPEEVSCAHGVHIWPRGSGRCAWSRVVVGPHIPTAWLLLRVPMGAASPACLRVCRHQLRVSDSLAEG